MKDEAGMIAAKERALEVVDEDLLRQEGVNDFTPYAMKPGQPLLPDYFLD